MPNTLVVESGSTKTDWILTTPEGTSHFQSIGINPASDPEMPILANICPTLIPHLESVEAVYYYGAGVIDQKTRALVKEMINYHSPNAVFSIQSDLTGACIATSKSADGIVSILGTGSNSCLYQEGKMKQVNPALGFIMSNEGGGTSIGKAIIKDYFYNRMSMSVKTEFESVYPIDRITFIDSLYRKANPTAFLAKFAPFVNQVTDRKYRNLLLSSVFQEFIDTRIKCFDDYDKYPLHFVGSIAYFCQDVLRETLQHNGLEATTILQRPIERLATVHK